MRAPPASLYGKPLTDHVVLLGNRHFNHFLVGGKGAAAVVECGVTGGVESARRQLEASGLAPQVRHLAATHAHFDHVCGIPALRDLFPDARVLASREARRVLSKKKIVENFFRQDALMSELLVGEGILEEAPPSPWVETIDVHEILAGGDRVDVGDGLFLEIIDAPGHSPCGLALWLEEDGVLFLSDACGFQISDDEIFPIFFQGYELYVQTIERLRKFPARVLALPHESLWAGEAIAGFYDRALASAREAFEAVRAMLDESLDERTMRERLLKRYYRGALRIYTPQNIELCADLIIRRVGECL